VASPIFGPGPASGRNRLAAGESHQLGTITFHAGALGFGTFEVHVDADELPDGVWDINGSDVSATTTFNSAFIVKNPTPTPAPTPSPTPAPPGPVVGWGYDGYGQTTPPDTVNGISGTATDIAAGSIHSCAIQSGTGKVFCWGQDIYGQATPPDAVNGDFGTATDIAASFSHTLAIAFPYPDFDGDGVGDIFDNCSERVNPAQDDTDGDDCGNLCDADYDNSGTVGFGDFGFFVQCYATTNELCQHVEPIGGGRTTGFADFGFFTAHFGTVPGPSGTTAGTTACP
jgi:hypothetical protein